MDKERVLEEHKNNPQLYKEFRRIMLEKCRQRKYYSGYAVKEIVRWETKTGSKSESYKINNDLIPLYVRLFIKEFPDYEEHYQIRTSRFDEKEIDQAQLCLFD